MAGERALNRYQEGDWTPEAKMDSIYRAIVAKGNTDFLPGLTPEIRNTMKKLAFSRMGSGMAQNWGNSPQ